MLEDNPMTGEFWCPLGEKGHGREAAPLLDLTADDRAALSRFSRGDWVSDAQIDRLLALGLVEKVFGQALLTRVGRRTIGIN